MPNEDQWTAVRIIEARKPHPLVTEAVIARVNQLFAGQLSERPLTSVELTGVAINLIGDMLPAPPKAEAKP